MVHTIAYTKTCGAGNDFVLIDNTNDRLEGDFAKLAVLLCNRHYGIGGDGLLILAPSMRAEFAMLYYNADGSYGGMCGNGGRCIARYAFLRGLAQRHLRFEALDHIYEASIVNDCVQLHMKNTSQMLQVSDLGIDSVASQSYYIDTGAPHVVVQMDDVHTVEVETIGRAIRYHETFMPSGTNVNFVGLRRGNLIDVRTYERGVERETLACGTGAVASAVVSSLVNGVETPVDVMVRSGEKVKVGFDLRDGIAQNVWLEGSAHMLFEGTAEVDLARNRLTVRVEQGGKTA